MSEVDKQPEDNDPQKRENRPGYMPGGITGAGFRPGVSGNPKGRPKKLTISELVEKIMRSEKTVVEMPDATTGRRVKLRVSKQKAMAYVLSQRLLAGDMRVVEYMGERRDPKRKPVDSEGDSGTPRIVRLPAGGPWGGQAAVRMPAETAPVPAPAPDNTPPAEETRPPSSDNSAAPPSDNLPMVDDTPPAKPEPKRPPEGPRVGDL